MEVIIRGGLLYCTEATSAWHLLEGFPIFSLSFHVGCSVSAQPRAISSPLHPYFTVALFTSGYSVSSLVAGVPKSSILLDLSAGAFLAYLLMQPVQDTSKMHFINLNNLRLYIFFPGLVLN